MTELYLSGGDTLQSVDHPNWQGQTFVLREDFILQFVDLQMKGAMRINTPTVQIFFAEITGEPWGDPLSRDRYIVEKKSGVFTTGRVRFSMQPVLLARPARFVLIVSNFPPLGGNSASWQYDKDNSTYPRGIRISSNDGGDTWTPHYNDDFMFALFGSPPLISPEPAPPLENFAATSLAPFHTPTSLTFTLETSVPCHLNILVSETPPRKYMTSRITRGLAVPWHVYYSFVEWTRIEQTALGDTMTHTFVVPNWVKCQTKWFTFRGKVDNIDSPSVGPIFTHHHPGATLKVHEQTLYDGLNFILPTRQRLGQLLTISNRLVGKLAFVLERHGSIISGPLSFTIRRSSDSSIIVSKIWGDVSNIPTDPTWIEATFDTPVYINEEVRILAEWPTSSFSVSNNLRFHKKLSDVKPSEIYTNYQDGSWQEPHPWDAAYRYSYYQEE